MLKIKSEIKCDDCGKTEVGEFPYQNNIGIDHDEFVFHAYTKYIQCKDCFNLVNEKWEKRKKERSFFARFSAENFYDYCPGYKGWKSGIPVISK